MTIIKAPDATVSVYDFARCNITEPGTKFGIKYKRGRRWKLKSFRLRFISHAHCESCGPYTTISFANTKNDVNINSHFGPHIVNCLNFK